MSNIPPYFAKLTPEFTSFKWDEYLQKVKEKKLDCLKDFDKIFLHYDYIFDDPDMIEVIDPVNNQYYYNVYFLEFYKGNYIQRHEKLFGHIQKMKKRLFQYEL